MTRATSLPPTSLPPTQRSEMPRPATSAARRTATVAGLVIALTLAGCSGDPSEDGSSEGAPDDGAPAVEEAPVDAGQAGTDRGGVSGLVASVADGVMQVQEADSQTAVTWTAETVVTRTAATTLDAVTVGSCVLVMLPADGAQTTAATSVVVSEPVDGACTGVLGGGFAGGQGDRPGGSGDGGAPSGELPELAPPTGELPDGAPSGELPDGMPGGFGGLVVGLVTAVDGTTLTVETTGTDGVTAAETVEASADTAVTATLAADASAIAVGLCATARGESDTRGGMAASSIDLSDAGADGCTRAGGMPGLGSGRPGAAEEDGDA